MLKTVTSSLSAVTQYVTRRVEQAGTCEWTIISIVVVVFGFLCMRGWKSRLWV